MGKVAVGFGSVTITPPLGTNMAGYFYPRGAEDVLDDLLAQAVAIEAGNDALILVACDLAGVDAGLVAEARDFVAGQINFPRERVCIGATHIHTGPDVVVRDPAIDKQVTRYRELLAQLIGSAAVEAWRRRKPGVIRWARGEAGHLCFNRRYRMKDGTVQTNPGRLNPNIVGPVGPTDPEVGILAFEAPDGAPAGFVVTFSLHCDTHGGNSITAEYPYFLRTAIAEALQAPVTTLFFAAPCGDVNHVDVTKEGLKGRANSQMIGEELARQVLAAIKSAQPVEVDRIRVARDVLEMPCRRPSEELKYQGLGTLGENWRDFYSCYVADGVGQMRFSMDRHAMRDALLLDELNVTSRTVELWCAALGDVGIATVPGELFVELGLEIKRKSPFKRNLLFELANGSVGYIPTKKAFAEGSYETTLRRSSCLIEDAGDRMVSRVTELLEGLQ
ncbi:MAG: hypothetical protein MUP15_09345 [Dehalococcoidia bacterium]|nr:hypothetical protein [Dehalococcoidia bacterium]